MAITKNETGMNANIINKSSEEARYIGIQSTGKFAFKFSCDLKRK